MRVAVVILNWNGKGLLGTFLPSVVSYSENATLYVADNASTDDSIEFVEENFPSINIIKNTTNGGYAKGYNNALEGLTEDIFVLLNSDVKVTKDWLSPLKLAFFEDKNLVAAQPKILAIKNKRTFEYAGAGGGFLDKYAYPFCRGRVFDTIEKDKGQYNDTIEIFWATGACLFLKREAFEAAGGFDEDFFAHQEEIDLCWRLQTLGGKIKYVGASTIYHLGGATLQTGNPKKTFYNFRNCLLMLLKNRKGASTYWLLFLRMLLDGVAAFQFLVRGKPKHFLAVANAHISFYLLLPKFIGKRKKWASTTPYSIINSIVWQYFVKQRHHFDVLKKDT